MKMETKATAGTKPFDLVMEQKAHFSHYNMVRMRETLRYLSASKLALFIEIPFLIHTNLPDFPGFVHSDTHPNGIFRFENSGFYKAAQEKNQIPHTSVPDMAITDPAVLALYHMGSLGTCTQSAGSDFDYWIIIDKTCFSDQRYYDFEKKLNHIVKYSRDIYHQKVTFFIMDHRDIRQNCYASFNDKETMTAPKFFIKEEFYRTFLMIAGKIPYWAILPVNGDGTTYKNLIQTFVTDKSLMPLEAEFIDLGHVTAPTIEDIMKGLLWQICKSVSDPIKALIKGTMIYAAGNNFPKNVHLLCDEIKNGYARAGIDDYQVDPYKSLFDRIITFYETDDPKGVELIKNAIFFRLCGYPLVKQPEIGSPKRQLLDHYIRTWNLKKVQINKMLEFQNWPESEKLVLEKTIVNRLAFMVKQVKETISQSGQVLNTLITEKRNFSILTHKTMKSLKAHEHKIPICSSFLKHQHVHLFLFTQKGVGEWQVHGFLTAGQDPMLLYRHSHLLGAVGWVLGNQIYDRYNTEIKIDTQRQLFESYARAVDPDKLYMVLQPLTPLSDKSYETNARWTKLLTLLLYGSPKNKENRLEKVEFLALNSWGEIFVEAMDIKMDIKNGEKTGFTVDTARKIAQKISGYDTAGLYTYFFQLSGAHDPEIVFQIKQHLPPTLLHHPQNRKTAGKNSLMLDIL